MNADLKISLHVRVYIKIVLWKICILNPYSPVPNNSPPFLFGLLLLVPHSPALLNWRPPCASLISLPLPSPLLHCVSTSIAPPLPLRLPLAPPPSCAPYCLGLEASIIGLFNGVACGVFVCGAGGVGCVEGQGVGCRPCG